DDGVFELVERRPAGPGGASPASHVGVSGEAHRLAFLPRSKPEVRGDDLVEVSDGVTKGWRPTDHTHERNQLPVVVEQRGPFEVGGDLALMAQDASPSIDSDDSRAGESGAWSDAGSM